MKLHFLTNAILGFALMTASVASCKSHGSAPRTTDKASADAGGATGNADTNAAKSEADKPDGTLDGIWGGYGSQKTGTEKAMKQ